MPKTVHYKANSVIYFQGDVTDKVFLLRTGKVNLVYQHLVTGEHVSDPLAAGEFFGVKSALGRYIREETALVVDDAMVIVFTIPEFEKFAMTNTPIVMKMLKVFSNQLQLIHRQLADVMGGDEPRPDAGLFRVGEYYLGGKRYSQARYVFNRYLTYYPAGKYADAAMKNLGIAEKALAGQGEGAGSAGGVSVPAGKAAEAAPSAKVPISPGDAVKAYYDAVGLVSREKYEQAYFTFKKIADSPRNFEYAAKSAYEMGRCLFLLGRYKHCIKYYAGILAQYPQHSNLCGIYYVIGQTYEKLGDKKHAAFFYQKILSMPAGDGLTVTKTRRALKVLGVQDGG
jgi:CRP-like cAMP-binding protein